MTAPVTRRVPLVDVLGPRDLPASCRRVVGDRRRAPATAHLRSPEPVDFRVAVGTAIERAARSLGWNLDELAAHVGRDPRQVRRWIAGTENAQFAVLLAVVALRSPLIIHLAMTCEDLSVRTVIEARRLA